MGPGVSRFLLYLPTSLEDGMRDHCDLPLAALAKSNNRGVVRVELRHVRGVVAMEPCPDAERPTTN